MSAPDACRNKVVRHFQQILLWPLQLVPVKAGQQIQEHGDLLARAEGDNPWREVADAFSGEPGTFP